MASEIRPQGVVMERGNYFGLKHMCLELFKAMKDTPKSSKSLDRQLSY